MLLIMLLFIYGPVGPDIFDANNNYSPHLWTNQPNKGELSFTNSKLL